MHMLVSKCIGVVYDRSYQCRLYCKHYTLKQCLFMKNIMSQLNAILMPNL